jgi:hypothetical protein
MERELGQNSAMMDQTTELDVHLDAQDGQLDIHVLGGHQQLQMCVWFAELHALLLLGYLFQLLLQQQALVHQVQQQHQLQFVVMGLWRLANNVMMEIL